MSVIGSNIIAGASGTVETGYQIARSLRFNSADSANLSRTPASAGNRKIWTWSGWAKRGKITTGSGRIFATEDVSSNQFLLRFDGSAGYDTLLVEFRVGNAIRTSALHRDPSAWYHIVVAIDTTQATASNRVKLYVNGIQVTAFSTATYPALNDESGINATQAHYIGTGYSEFYDGYLADVRFIDGQALTPSSFGETDANTGVWVPKTYTGTYGTNGFWLKFDDNSGTTSTTLGKDSSGNGNNWTPNNFSVTAGVGNDSLVDSPTNYGTDTGAGGEVRGNYATLNPLSIGSGITLSNGNLDFSSGTSNSTARSTFGVSSGKWYWEVTPTTASPTVTIGVTDASTFDNSVYVGSTATSYSYYTANGNKYNNGTGTSYGASIAQNDVVGVALDMDAGTLTFYKNGVSQGTAFTGITGTKQPAISINTASTYTASLNFGQRPFAYTAPSGFKALCTQNLPTPAVGASASTLASKNFNVATYTGTGATQNITGFGFQPDLVWNKARNNIYGNGLQDVIRGVNKQLYSHVTTAEFTTPAGTGLTAFLSDGFTLGTDDAGSSAYMNQNGVTYVSWSWKANGAGSSNTAGSISSTVSANTTAGISIVTYTGTGANATVGHGLGKAPSMIIVKSRSNALDWIVYHASVGNTAALFLNGTNAKDTNSAYWQNTTPTSTVFSLGTTTAGNTNAATQVAYCFAEIAGFSKFGSYTGNASTDGTFVYCGFRPRYVMIKRTDVANDWGIFDTARNTYNLTDLKLWANSANAENSTIWTVSENNIDILSNGFKVRVTNAGINASGGTYIFAAFGEAPFNYSRAR